MEPHANIQEQLEAIDAKIDAIWESVEKTRRYFQIALWVTLAVIVLPMIGLVFTIPAIMKALTVGLNI